VEDLKKRRLKKDRTLYSAFVGDLGDLNSHGGISLISHMQATIHDMMLQVFQPAIDMSDHAFILAGTASHTGGRGELEEWLANDLNTESDPSTGKGAWFHLLLDVEGVLFDIAHHPATAASRPWTWGPAAARHAEIIRLEYLEAGERVPDVAVRFHRHHYQQGPRQRPPFFVYGPSWQLTTPYGYRRGAGAIMEPVGLLIFLVDDGTWTFDDSQIFQFKRSQPWTKRTRS
jgi:hypothetical protein